MGERGCRHPVSQTDTVGPTQCFDGRPGDERQAVGKKVPALDFSPPSGVEKDGFCRGSGCCSTLLGNCALCPCGTKR